MAELDKNQNVSLAFQFSLPEAILTRVQSTCEHVMKRPGTLARRVSDCWDLIARRENLLAPSGK